MRCTALLVLLAIVGVSALPANFEPVDFTDIIAYAEAQEQLWLDNIQYGKDKPYPQTTGTDGLWSTGDYNNHESWGSNYGVGSAWMLYELTGKKQKWFDEGSRLQEYFLSNQFRTNSHDVGMICMTIYGNNYKFTGNTSMEQILVNAAAALSTRYNPAVELIMSWSTRANTYQVITDNMMNLELLLVAHKLTGNATFHKIALDHARNTAKWFLREDGGSFHVLDMSVTNGRPLVRGTQQGYSAFSTWGRGHAWLVYGYAYMYKWTQLPEFKQLFEQVTQYWIDHQLPAADGSYVAVWDFDDPDKNKPRDTSASAPLLAGLLRMALTEDKPADSIYFEKAHYLMKEMSSSPYLNSTDHTWQSLLRQGSRDVPANKQNTGISWGDYYYLESITYYKEIVATL